MTSPGDPVYTAAQIIQACEQGVHNPQLIPRSDQLTAARMILIAASSSWSVPDRLTETLESFPTTQTLFPQPLNHQETKQ